MTQPTRSIKVDLDRCEGHGRCYAIAPELMRPFDDHGHAEFCGSPIDSSNAQVVEVAQRTISSCPEEALSWSEE